MKYFLFTGVLCLFMACAFAQPSIQSKIPPSPTAYAFAKYGDIPVSLSTGIPQISVPLYQLVDHDLSVDLSLSYYAGGIKVDEQATDVGLGWVLNAGGTITRVTKGMPDQLTSAGFFPRTNIPMNTANQYTNISQFITDHNLDGDITGSSDNEPDIFIFNFNGKSGKFSFDASGHAVLQKKEDLAITWQQNPLKPDGFQEFIITDERGVVYRFSDFETTPDSRTFNAVISAWYLTSITSPTGNVITFTYADQSSNHEYIRNDVPNVGKTNFNGNWIIPINEASSTPYDLPQLSGRKITGISSGNGTVEFKYHTGTDSRQDTYQTEYALDQVVIHDASNQVVRSFKLTTSYFEADNAHKFPGTATQFQHLNKRLRLDAVQEINPFGLAIAAPYQFTYLGDNNPAVEDVYTLPYRMSPEIDHWGYYNRSGNTNIYPGTSQTMTTKPWFNSFKNTSQAINLSGGANREPDAEAMKAGMLQRITYPTGGYTDFQFEANYSSAYKVGGVRLQSTKSYPVTGPAKEKHYTYVGNYTVDPYQTYFQFYAVDSYLSFDLTFGTFTQKIAPQSGILQMFGLPSNVGDYPSGTITQPILVTNANALSVLGLSAPGYDQVTETEPGNGHSVNIFDNSTYPDYTQAGQQTVSETALLGTTFQSELISGYPNNVYLSQNLSYSDWMGPNMFDNSWKRGLLKEKDDYSEANVLVKSVTFNYERTLLNVLPAFKISKYTQNDYPFQTGYIYTQYGVSCGQALLKSQTETIYDQSGVHGTSTTTNYAYESQFHLQPTRVETTRSDNRVETSLTTYPPDYASGTPALDAMVSHHLINYPVEQVKYIDDGAQKNIVSGTLNLYKGASGLPDEVKLWKKQTSSDLAAFKFSNRNSTGAIPGAGNPDGFAPDTRYESRVKYYDYDSKGNLKSVSKTNGPATSYVWGYNANYPIAQATGAQYNEIYYNGFEGSADFGGVTVDPTKAHTGRSSGLITNPSSSEVVYHANNYLQVDLHGLAKVYKYSGWIYSNGPSSEIFVYMKRAGETNDYTYFDNVGTAQTGGWVYLEKTVTVPADVTQIAIRVDNNGGGNVWFDDLRLFPADAQMTSYTYDALVGMTSATDSKNITTYYEYDDQKRLAYIRDNDRNIVKAYCYNFQGQATNCLVPPTPAALPNQIVYTRLETSDQDTEGFGDQQDHTTYTTYNVYIRFYSNPECTLPLTLNASRTITVAKWQRQVTNGGVYDTLWNDDYTATAGVSEYYVGSWYVSSYHDWYDEYFNTYYDYYTYQYGIITNPSSSYIPEPIVNH